MSRQGIFHVISYLMEYSYLRYHLTMLRTYCDNLQQIIKTAYLL